MKPGILRCAQDDSQGARHFEGPGFFRGKIGILNRERSDGSESLVPARGFDVLCLPIIEWDFRFQRPQQLLAPFARDGHRVFYLKTGFLGLDREPVLRPLRNMIPPVRAGGVGLDLSIIVAFVILAVLRSALNC